MVKDFSTAYKQANKRKERIISVDKPVNKYVNRNDFLGLTKKEYEDYQDIISWKET